jgi:uncharacterized Fe-S center protein
MLGDPDQANEQAFYISRIKAVAMATVYFSETIDEESIKKGFSHFKERITKDDKVAIKAHFGEDGNTRYINAKYYQPMVDMLKEIGCEMFISDCNTLYRGRRVKGSDHKALAEEHGFGSLGIPIIIGDGELGKDEYAVPVDGTHFKEVYIGDAYKDATVVLLVSHFKGHAMGSFGGAIKNAGMGMGSRKGKMAMHSTVHPSVNTSKCISCEACLKACDHKAIVIDEKAKIDDDKCVGCAMCISSCPTGAIGVPWRSSTAVELMEKTAEYAYGALHGKRVIAVNFIMDITEHCDCLADSKIIGEDVGVAFSDDPVALDAASLDLVVKKNGEDIFKKHHGFDGMPMLKRAEEMGVGSVEYTLDQ